MAIIGPPDPSASAAPSASARVPTAAAVALANGMRLKAVVERLALFYGGTHSIPASDVSRYIYVLARGIDIALTHNDIPNVATEIPTLVKKVYQHKNDSTFHSALMVLVISAKNACKRGWFHDSDANDILKMEHELSARFSMSRSLTEDGNNTLSTISLIFNRFYPRLKLCRVLVSCESKPGYDILMADFFIQKNLPGNESIKLFVAKKDNLETPSCIVGPPHASFLVNGKGVEKRNNVYMDSGPLIPSDINKMVKYGTNIVQAVGHFDSSYLIAILFVTELTPKDAPQLEHYVKPATANDGDVLEGPSRISLNCPISLKRIKTPIKGKKCKHIQCFDYENYMEMNSRKPYWRCPCCNSLACYSDLRIDESMAKILQEVGPIIVDVLISADGTWNAVEPSSMNRNELSREKVISRETLCPESNSAATPGPIDLTMAEDDHDLRTPEIEDRKPFSNQCYGTEMLLEDTSLHTSASDVTLNHGAAGDLLDSLATSSQALVVPSVSNHDTLMFGTLESIMPENVLHPPAIFDSLQPDFSFPVMPQQMAQQTGILRGQLLENAQCSIPRSVRRIPVATQALQSPSQSPGLSRRPETRSDDVEMLPRPNTVVPASIVVEPQNQEQVDAHGSSQNLSRPWNYGAPVLHRSVPPHLSSSRLPRPSARGMPVPRGSVQHIVDPRSSSNMQTQPVILNTSSQLPSVPRSARPLVGQVARGIIPPFGRLEALLSNSSAPHLMAPSRTATGNSAVAPANLRHAHPFASTTSESTRPPGTTELPVEQNWRPTGRMRGSLTGEDYVAAFNHYSLPSRQPSQPGPPNVGERRH